MRAIMYLLSLLFFAASLTSTAFASDDNFSISSVIETFIVKRFPEVERHFWVVNSTEWGADDEVVVDLNAVVLTRGNQAPTERRFLLLIVGGKLAGMQSVPLDASIECQPDEVV